VKVKSFPYNVHMVYSGWCWRTRNDTLYVEHVGRMPLCQNRFSSSVTIQQVIKEIEPGVSSW